MTTPETSLNLWDRLVYGALSAAFGAVLGLVACLCLFHFFYSEVSVRTVVLGSACYFCAIGVFRGAGAGSIVGDTISVVTGVLSAETGGSLASARRGDAPRRIWASPVLLLGWLAFVLFLAFRG